jgi:hypothetical protein
MAAPAVAEFTRRLWDDLPHLYRAADADQPAPNDFPLLRFLSLLGDQADELATIYGRLALHDDGTGDWISDLATPALVDDNWLEWLALLVGVDPAQFPNHPALRQALDRLSFDAGSRASVIRVITDYLSPPARFLIVRFYGNVWTVLLIVHPDDIHATTWNELEAGFPDWGAVNAAGSWNAIGGVDEDLLDRLAPYRPAGVTFVLAVQSNTWIGIESLGSWAAVEALGSWDAVENGGW